MQLTIYNRDMNDLKNLCMLSAMKARSAPAHEGKASLHALKFFKRSILPCQPPQLVLLLSRPFDILLEARVLL